MISNSKGNIVGDGILWLVVLFVFSIVAIIGYQFVGDINTDLQADADISAEAKASLSSSYSSYNATFDGGFIFILAFIWIMILVSAYLLDNNPIFLVVSVVLLVIILGLGIYLSNTWLELADEGDWGDVSTNFPMTYWVYDNFLITMIAMVCSVLLVLYGKEGGF